MGNGQIYNSVLINEGNANAFVE